LSYTVSVGQRTEKELRRKIHSRDVERIRHAIAALAEDPYPRESRKLQGAEGYRLRVGRDYRVMYLVDEEAQEITITRVGSREDFYG
jgi:mRNA interferase RelE/StbE